MKCPECDQDLKAVQDEFSGRLVVCDQGHWWVQDYKKLQLDRIQQGEKHAA